MSSTTSAAPKKRSLPEEESSPSSSSSSKMAKTSYKGLRQFSWMVCQKVQELGTTTYQQVADELVKILDDHQRDEKNIRRRVYDALNVLMAMNVICKSKKLIFWKGLPTTQSHDLQALQSELEYRQSQIAKKRQAVIEMLTQQVCFRNLVQVNKNRVETSHKIPLPFIVINTNKNAIIQCNMSRDLNNVMFDFSMPFEINDDNTILKKLGLHKTTSKVLREMLPNDMFDYCMEYELIDHLIE